MSLINPADSLERQNEKLHLIARSLMRRVEQKNEDTNLAYQQFERAALLETQVQERTRDLERTLDLLQESNARLEVANLETEAARVTLTDALETINDGFALFDTDDRLVLFNSRFCRGMDDITASLKEGLSFVDYVTLISRSDYLFIPEEDTRENWARQRVARHGDDHGVFNVELHDSRWLQVSEHRTSRGGTVILQTDVTDIIQLERQERDRMRDRQALMLQATLDHLNQGVCIFDSNLVLVGWNKRMDGLLAMPSSRSMPDLSFEVLLDRLGENLVFHGEDNRARLRRWARSTERREPLAFEIDRSDHSIYSVFAREMPDRGFVISFTNVTAEREAAQTLSEMNELLERRVSDRTEELAIALSEAERANASKSRFVAAASHDLLQPLSAAKLFVSSLADRAADDETQLVVRKTEAALQGAEQIIGALLDISKLDAGKAVFRVQPMRLSDVLSPLQNELAPVAAAKGIDLRVVNCALTVRSDPGYLRRIVQNLLTNAIRYTDQGRVLLGVRRAGSFARIEVWDTGRGIAADNQQAVFQEFNRLDASNANTGLGLGLAIVERACRGLGHRLDLCSEPGVGSRFSLDVPIHSAHPLEAGGDIASPRPENEHLNGLLMMLVESDETVAGTLSTMIEDLGAEVIHAHDAEEALTLLHEIQLLPDAFLLSFQLGPVSTGIDLHGQIHKIYGPVTAAILAIDPTPELRATCEQTKLPILSKPIDKEQLRHFLIHCAET